MAIFGNMAKLPLFGDPTGRGVGQILIVNVNAPLIDLAQTGDDLDQFSLAIALNTGDANNFTGMNFKRDIAQGGVLQIITR